MAMLTMAFSFTEGPHSTPMTYEQIANAVSEVAGEQRFMGLMRRSLKTKPSGTYGAFVPTDEDDRFVLDDTRTADWRIGWRREYRELVPHGGVRELGWRVVFEVFDTGAARHVVATVQGESERQEVKRFVRYVFDRLSWG